MVFPVGVSKLPQSASKPTPFLLKQTEQYSSWPRDKDAYPTPLSPSLPHSLTTTASPHCPLLPFSLSPRLYNYPTLFSLLAILVRKMEDTKRWQIPAFGDWDYCDEMPITQYFESARQAGLVRTSFFEEDRFKVPVALPVKSAYQSCPSRRKVRKGSNDGGEETQCSKEQQRRKQGKVSRDSAAPQRRPTAVPKPVDEDLYKIPPELLYQKPKRKSLMTNLFSGCLGLSCIT